MENMPRTQCLALNGGTVGGGDVCLGIVWIWVGSVTGQVRLVKMRLKLTFNTWYTWNYLPNIQVGTYMYWSYL